jgi:XTP/dITP diphosphohydrolase
MNKLFIASKNKGKINEIRSVLSGLGIEFFSLLDTPDIPDIEETGTTFEENASIKAQAVFEIVKIPVLADDSGLAVEYLNGAPGVYSARYAGENASDSDNCSKLLNEMERAAYNERKASFICVIILFDGENKRVFEGACNGHIITYLRGENGFGYDPLFVPDNYSKTFAELDLDTKNKISHRGKALASVKKFLELENEISK